MLNYCANICCDLHSIRYLSWLFSGRLMCGTRSHVSGYDSHIDYLITPSLLEIEQMCLPQTHRST